MIERKLVIDVKMYNIIAHEIEKLANELQDYDIKTDFCISKRNIKLIIKSKNENDVYIYEKIQKYLLDIYSRILKRRFFQKKMNVFYKKIKENDCEFLLNTFVVFDREGDREEIMNRLRIDEIFCIDGFFNFRLKELREKWLDIFLLAQSNSLLVQDEKSFNTFLRFLLSTASPKSNEVKIKVLNGKYKIFTNYSNSNKNTLLNETALLNELIDVAPNFILIDGYMSNKKFLCRLKDIFDVKYLNKTLIFGENA